MNRTFAAAASDWLPWLLDGVTRRIRVSYFGWTNKFTLLVAFGRQYKIFVLNFTSAIYQDESPCQNPFRLKIFCQFLCKQNFKAFFHLWFFFKENWSGTLVRRWKWKVEPIKWLRNGAEGLPQRNTVPFVEWKCKQLSRAGCRSRCHPPGLLARTFYDLIKYFAAVQIRTRWSGRDVARDGAGRRGDGPGSR